MDDSGLTDCLAGWRRRDEGVADRFQGRPRQFQLAAGIAELARLSPQQRTHARLKILDLAQRYSARQRKDQWQGLPDNEDGIT